MLLMCMIHAFNTCHLLMRLADATKGKVVAASASQAELRFSVFVQERDILAIFVNRRRARRGHETDAVLSIIGLMPCLSWTPFPLPLLVLLFLTPVTVPQTVRGTGHSS